MTAAQHTIHYDLSTREDFERLLAEMHEAEAGTIIIAFSPASSLDPTDLEFARLVAAARDLGKRLVAETTDHRLANRALMHGFEHSAVVSDAPRLNLYDTKAIAPAILQSADTRSRLRNVDTTANIATYSPAQPEQTDHQGNGREEEPAAAETQTETVVTRDEPPESHSAQTAPDPESNTIDAQLTEPVAPAGYRRQPRTISAEAAGDDEEESEVSPDSRRRGGGRRRRRKGLILAAAVVAPVVVLGLVAVLVLYLLPTAEISLTPVEDPISSSLTYGVAVGDANYDVTVDPSPLTNASSADATRESSGERFEPDGTATGTIRITNPFTSEVTVPAGTDFSGPNSVTYYTSDDAIIPAADPFGSLSFGAGTIEVYAGVPGPDGNLDVGGLTGQLGNGLFYSNQEAIAGGTLRRIETITEDDIAAVEDEVETALLDKAEREFTESIPEGFELVPDSIEVGEPDIDVTGEAGADGTEVSASGTIDVRGQIFNPEELHERAHEEASRLLASQGGNDRILLANSVAVSEPTALDSTDTGFRIEANATVRRVITVEEQERLINDLVGMSRADAEQLLAEHPNVSNFELVIEPDWLPERIPEIASRIDVQVSDGEQTTATR